MNKMMMAITLLAGSLNFSQGLRIENPKPPIKREAFLNPAMINNRFSRHPGNRKQRRAKAKR